MVHFELCLSLSIFPNFVEIWRSELARLPCFLSHVKWILADCPRGTLEVRDMLPTFFFSHFSFVVPAFCVIAGFDVLRCWCGWVFSDFRVRFGESLRSFRQICKILCNSTGSRRILRVCAGYCGSSPTGTDTVDVASSFISCREKFNAQSSHLGIKGKSRFWSANPNIFFETVSKILIWENAVSRGINGGL